MDFEEKLIQDLGEERRTIYPTAVYAIDDDRVYLDVLNLEKETIECRGYSKGLFDKMNIKIGTPIWLDYFTQPGKVIIKVKLAEANDGFPTLQFLKVLTENVIMRPDLKESKSYCILDDFSKPL